MRILYFIIPFIFAGIFSFYYFSEKTQIEAKSAADKAEQQRKAEVRKQEELAAKERAKKDADILYQKRLAEREVKDAEEAARKEEIQKANDALAFAKQERERVRKQLTRLQEDHIILKDQLARAREQVKSQNIQVDYVKNSVKEAKERKSIFVQAFDKLEAAERAAAAVEAERLAALAAAARGKKS